MDSRLGSSGVTCEHLNRLVDSLGTELWTSKESLACSECGCTGPNLWLCLQPECRQVGCSELDNDHSTLHHKNVPTHCVHMNVSTERIWCYACEREVHLRAALSHSKILSGNEGGSVGGSCSPPLSLGRSAGLNVSPSDDEEDMEADPDTDERPRGLVGLQNMGNTCYMNAALQALSNTPPLTEYFLDSSAISLLACNKKPGLSRAYQKLMKDMWSRRTRGYVVPSGVLYGIRSVHPMFRGYHQHDTQEFLRCFMDQLHEELKQPVRDVEDRLAGDTEGLRQQTTRTLVEIRQRAASSGASDASKYFPSRRKSPAPSTRSESRADGYLRLSASEGVSRHQRSASFAGIQHQSYSPQLPVHSMVVDGGSDSDLSSSGGDDRYETCSSGGASDTADPRTEHIQKDTVCGGGDGGGVRYRSVISDVFDGELLSSVQCHICNRVSQRVETFQDLSLPIPSREHMAVLRSQQPPHNTAQSAQDSWMWWLLSWVRSWFYGPVVSLQDCLAAFFSADELKGDNMYSCSRCNKLRNGVKMSGVVRLPEVLCVHLKRFRHELMFSAKVGARVSFPLQDLNMAPYLHKECTSKIHRYELCAVICHAGTAGGGHYTCIARNGRAWYEFDDQCVTQVPRSLVTAAEAYVLFYRKVNPQMAILRQKAAEILEQGCEPNDLKFYISKQWINKFNTWAEPGRIDNGDFVCTHGGVRPERVAYVQHLAAVVPQRLWRFLHRRFGGGPACTHVHECTVCARAAERLRARRARELNRFNELYKIFQEQENPRSIYAISMHWFRQWQAFVRDKTPQPPPPVDNMGVSTKQESSDPSSPPVYTLKPGSDHAQLSEELWRFFVETYGGGPELRLRSQPEQSQLESEREYCTRSVAENGRMESPPRPAQSLQNLDASYRTRVSTDSDEDNHSRRRRISHRESPGDIYHRESQGDIYHRETQGDIYHRETQGDIYHRESRGDIYHRESHDTAHRESYREHNGNVDSDQEMDTTMYNGEIDNNHAMDTEELPNLDNISLKGKKSKVKRVKKRTVK